MWSAALFLLLRTQDITSEVFICQAPAWTVGLRAAGRTAAELEQLAGQQGTGAIT
jgi:hypothetical protein